MCALVCSSDGSGQIFPGQDLLRCGGRNYFHHREAKCVMTAPAVALSTIRTIFSTQVLRVSAVRFERGWRTLSTWHRIRVRHHGAPGRPSSPQFAQFSFFGNVLPGGLPRTGSGRRCEFLVHLGAVSHNQRPPTVEQIRTCVGNSQKRRRRSGRLGRDRK